jgi:hypothetical protein
MIAFILLCILYNHPSLYLQFPDKIYIVLSVVDCVAALGFLIYGIRISSQLCLSENTVYVFQSRKNLLKRVLGICVLNTCIFLLRSVYDILFSTHNLSFYFVPSIHPRLWDGINYSILEGIPTFFILILTALPAKSTAQTHAERLQAEEPSFNGLNGEYPVAHLLPTSEVEANNASSSDYPEASIAIVPSNHRYSMQ